MASNSSKNTRGIVMLSGGLDSTLAARLLLEQGIELLGITFSNGFSNFDQLLTASSLSTDIEAPLDVPAETARSLGIPFRRIEYVDESLDFASSPAHGYGKNMNPCIDCRLNLLKKAGEIMKEESFDFVATGEVMGQRPMSQRRDAMRIVERECGLEGRLLRPLCALLLPPIIPEEEGLVDRSRLLGLSGRSRKPQMALAEKLGITDYPSPAGGCLLTDESYSKRFADKLKSRGRQGLSRKAMLLLKLGRHFRIRENLKLVVGRNKSENDILEHLAEGTTLFNCVDVPGPIGLTDEGAPSADETKFCASLVARYSDGKNMPSVKIEIQLPSGESAIEEIRPLQDEPLLESMRI